MLSFLISLLSLFHITYGQAAYYSDGVFEDVIRMRQAGNTAMSLPRELPPVIGYVATPYCEEVGDQVWLYHRGELAGPYLVADCCISINGDCERMGKKGIVVEVDWNTAQRWKVVGYGPELIDVAVIRLNAPIITPKLPVGSPGFLPVTEYERSLQ